MAGPLTPPIGTRFSTGQDAALLDGPTSPPAGAVVLSAGSTNLDALTSSNPAGTTFYLQAGRHTLGGGAPNQFTQVVPKNGNTYIGAPGAVLDGLSICQYAFTQHATNVMISHLEIMNFVCPFDEFAVNHDTGDDWTIEYCHIHHNGGAAIGVGTDNTIRYCWLHHNQQYGFSSYKSPVNDGLTPAITNVLVDHCEISHNGDMRDEVRPDGTSTGNGRNGSCKFWDTQGITVSNSWVHHSSGTAIWADTNNISCLLDGNLIEDNAGVGFFYEISYNFKVTNNTFRRNNFSQGVSNNQAGDSFPRAAIYISESGGDSRVAALYASSEISGNTFSNNWDDIALWESSDRFCNSPANTSGKVYKPLGGAASMAVCNNPSVKTLTVTLTSGSPNFTVTSGTLESTDEGRPISGTGIPAGTKIVEPRTSNGFAAGVLSDTSGVMAANATTSGTVTMTLTAGTINVSPGNYDCRWHTQNIIVQNNTFDHNASEVYGPRNTPNSNPLYTSGRHGMFSQYGTYPAWSPYQGTTIQDLIVTQGNVWQNNTYRGDYRFVLKDTSNQVNYTTWRAAPYGQDTGSTFSATPPVGGGGGTVYLPDPPTAVTATAGNGQARVHFTPPVDIGGDTLTGYTVTASPGGATATALSGPITVTGLTNGTAYTFTVVARTTVGASIASAASSAVTPSSGASLPTTTIPWQPIKPAAKKASTSSAVVSFFKPDSTGGSAITSYTVTATDSGNNTTTASGSSSPITVSGLAADFYTFTVKATNAVGTGPASQASPRVSLGASVPLNINLPTSTADGAAGHTAAHNATNTAVNAIGAAVDAVAQPWQFRVEDYGAVGNGTTDDSAAIQSAVDAAFSYATSSGRDYAEVVFQPRTYLIAGAYRTTGYGNAQIAIPYRSVTARKVTLVLRGAYEASALPIWTQTEPQRSGTVLKSTGAGGTPDATNGVYCVVGGPSSTWGFGQSGSQATIGPDTGLFNTWNNMMLVIDGISIRTPSPANQTGFYFGAIAEVVVGSASVFSEASPAGTPAYALPTNTSAVGLHMPGDYNNANNHIRNFSCEGMYRGLILGEHTVVDNLRVVYCHTGVYVGNSAHHSVVHYAVIEVCKIGIFYQGHADFLMADFENNSATGGAFATQYYVQADGNAVGTVRYFSLDGNSTLVDPNMLNISDSTAVRVLDARQQPGYRDDKPSVPSSTSFVLNPFFRDAFVTVTGGTVSLVEVWTPGPTATYRTVATATNTSFMVPTRGYVKLTYSSAPTWNWCLTSATL